MALLAAAIAIGSLTGGGRCGVLFLQMKPGRNYIAATGMSASAVVNDSYGAGGLSEEGRKPTSPGPRA